MTEGNDNRPKTLLEILALKFPQSSKTTLRQMLAHGRVKINGRVIKIGSTPVRDRQTVEIADRKSPKVEQRKLLESVLNIVHEDDDVLVIHKPAGLLTSTTPNEKRETLLELVQQYIGIKDPGALVGLIHRLDKDASGLLVFSLNRNAYESLKQQFFVHSVDRVYAAVVGGKYPGDAEKIESYLVEHKDGSVHSTKLHHKGQHAITFVTVVKKTPEYSLLKVKLETGRKHQIRAHLSEKSHPIVGDAMYNGIPADMLMLCAIELTFDHPLTHQRMKFELPIPEIMCQLVKMELPKV